MPPHDQPQQIADARTLRALAHPLRQRLLQEISALGHGRAADLATTTGSPANQVSFHLRELARHGLLVEAPEFARDRRDRAWKPASSRGTRIESRDLLGDPDGRAAYELWRGHATAKQHELVESASRPGWPSGTFVGVTDDAARLTKDEASAMFEEIAAVIEKWAEHGRSHSPGEADVRTYLTLAITQPQRNSATPPE